MSRGIVPSISFTLVACDWASHVVTTEHRSLQGTSLLNHHSELYKEARFRFLYNVNLFPRETEPESLHGWVDVDSRTAKLASLLTQLRYCRVSLFHLDNILCTNNNNYIYIIITILLYVFLSLS